MDKLTEHAFILLEEACKNADTVDELEDIKELLESAAEDIDDVVNNCGERDTIREAVDALYESAMASDDLTYAQACIMKADEIQKAIGDIPEESPIEDRDYPDDVSGGSGPELTMDEIKDLVGDDPEAIKLLLDDSDGKTIDA